MVPLPPVKVEDFEFPATVKAPGSDNTFILAGAGARGLEIQGKFIKFTAIGVYVEEGAAVSALGEKWKGKSAAELAESFEFFRDVVTGYEVYRSSFGASDKIA
ncbi:Chalcone--flavanone isomerase-like protein [Drosera capensis]